MTSPEQPARQPRRWAGHLLLLIGVGLLGGVLSSSMVFVDETEFVIIERLGVIVDVCDRADDKGLHFKWPWPFGTVRRFDARVHIFDPPAREMFTADTKNTIVDTYVCWRIASPADGGGSLDERPVVTFFRSLGTAEVAESRLDSRVQSVVSSRIGDVSLSDMLSASDSDSSPDPTDGPLESISRAIRDDVEQRESEAAPLRQRWGIEIVDVRVKRINFPIGNQQDIFERMRSERSKIAAAYRSAGEAESQAIRSRANRQYEEILAKANAQSERLRGEAEATVVRILNEAHHSDPQLFRLLQTLDAYSQILGDRTTFVLSASNRLLRLLTEGIPDGDESSSKSAPDLEPRPDEQDAPDDDVKEEP